MLFLGATFLSGDMLSVACTPTNVTNIDDIKLMNCKADDLYLSSAVLEAEPIVPNWGWDTVFYAQFNYTTFAGSTSWSTTNAQAILIKRKRADENLWTTIFSRPIVDRTDFNVYGQDITPTNGSYEYVVTCVVDGFETEYYSTGVFPVKIDRLIIADDNQIWTTFLTNGYCDTTKVVPSSVLEPMYDRYPTIVSNAATNYQTIEVTGNFMPYDCDNDDPNTMLDDETRVKYINDFLEFLSNRKTKILKNIDGREWLVSITTPPTDAAQDHYKIRLITFGCTEIGNCNGEEELYNGGFINTDPAYWSYS